MIPTTAKCFTCDEHPAPADGMRVERAEMVTACQIGGRRHEFRVWRSARVSTRLDSISGARVTAIRMNRYGESGALLDINRAEIPALIAALTAVYEATDVTP